jgi:tetratricopeptide (TPR) repeat protein
MRAYAAVACQDLAVLESVLPKLGEGFHYYLISGVLLDLQGAERSGVEAAYQEALRISASRDEKIQALRVLAGVGATNIDEIADREVPELEGLEAATLGATIAIAKSSYQEAIEFLRPWENIAPEAARMLAEVHYLAGEVSLAARTFVDAAKRFHLGRMAGRAAFIQYNARDLSGAEDSACEALSFQDLPSRARKEMNILRIRICAAEMNWQAAEERAREARQDMPEDADICWMFIQALYNQQKFNLAWTELNRYPKLVPTSSVHACLMAVLAGFSLSGNHLSRYLLDVIDGFPDDEEVVGSAIIAYIGKSSEGDVEEDTLRWREVCARFMARNPEHPSFRTIRLSKDGGADAMTEALRPVLETEAVEYEAARQEVLRGRAPYALMSARSGRPYLLALVQRAAGCLPIGGGTTEIRELELAAARGAINSSVSIDTSVLAVNSYIPDCWVKWRSLFATVELTAHARADIALAKISIDRPADGFLDWDLEAGQPRMTKADPVVMAKLRQQVDWVVRSADGLHIRSHQLSSSFFATIGDVNDQRFLPWAGSLDLALVKGLPLFSDDSAVRGLARSHGVAAFGTEAIIDLLEEKGQIDSAQGQSWRHQLRAQWCVDLPFVVPELVALAESQDWLPTSAAGAIARASAWLDLPAALHFWHQAIERTSADISTVAGWLHYGIVGFGMGHSAIQVRDMARYMLFRSLDAVGASTENFSLLLMTATQACEEVEVPDLLESVISDMAARLEARQPPGMAVRMILASTSGMRDGYRRRVLGTLLGVTG